MEKLGPIWGWREGVPEQVAFHPCPEEGISTEPKRDTGQHSRPQEQQTQAREVKT